GAGTSSTGSCWAGVEITSSTSTTGLSSLGLPAAEAASAAEGAGCSCVLLGARRSAAASAGIAAVGSSTGCSTCAGSEACVRVGVVAFDGAGDGGVAGASFAAEEVFDEDAARFVVLFVAVVVDLPAFVPAEVEPAAFEPVDFPAAAFEPVDFPAAAFVPSDLEPADFVPADFEAADFVAALFVLELLVPVDLVPEDVAPEDVPLELAAEAAERVVPLPAFRDREPVRAGASAAVGCALSSSGAEAAARAAAERRPPLLPVRPRRSAAARAIPVARSRAPARSRWAFSSSRETYSPEKNMSTGRTPPASPSEPAVGRVRVRSSCSGAGVEP